MGFTACLTLSVEKKDWKPRAENSGTYLDRLIGTTRPVDRTSTRCTSTPFVVDQWMRLATLRISQPILRISYLTLIEWEICAQKSECYVTPWRKEKNELSGVTFIMRLWPSGGDEHWYQPSKDFLLLIEDIDCDGTFRLSVVTLLSEWAPLIIPRIQPRSQRMGSLALKWSIKVIIQ